MIRWNDLSTVKKCTRSNYKTNKWKQGTSKTSKLTIFSAGFIFMVTSTASLRDLERTRRGAPSFAGIAPLVRSQRMIGARSFHSPVRLIRQAAVSRSRWRGHEWRRPSVRWNIAALTRKLHFTYRRRASCWPVQCVADEAPKPKEQQKPVHEGEMARISGQTAAQYRHPCFNGDNSSEKSFPFSTCFVTGYPKKSRQE